MMVVRHSYISAKKQRAVGGRSGKVVAISKAMAHVKYIQHRPGEDRGDGGREMFNETEDAMDSKELRKAIKEMGKANVVIHKVTLAPEINPEDKKAFTREVMKQLGSDKGLDLRWAATAHSNTDHHHIHVVILGKDKSGRDVRLDKRDYDKIKEFGDRYLERVHPLELNRARTDREEKTKRRRDERQKEKETARQERVRDGLELPWMHKKIIREQLEPYDQWKAKKLEQERAKKEKAKEASAQEREVPFLNDSIHAAGEEWSKKNTLKELQKLNEHLWDNYDERIPVDEYKKLVGWIKDKERNGERDRSQPDKQVPDKEKEDREVTAIQHKGQKYTKDSPHEKLSELSAKLREKDAERLPVAEYQALRGWMENADRARWSGVLERQIGEAKEAHWKERAQSGMPDNFRVATPMQDAVMGNPVVGLFMKGAAVVNELVKWIPLTDQRDRLKEGRDDLESAKLDKVQQHNQAGRPEDQKAQDRETIEKLDQKIEENQAKRNEATDEKKRKKWERDNTEDWDKYDPWGRY